MNIIICDDRIDDRKNLSDLLSDYGEKKNYEFAITEYESGEQLCEEQSALEACQLLFLDINMQGMEVYNGKMICYSLGNFCFGGNKNPADKNTAIYQQAFTLINGELQPGIDAQIIPCTLSSVSSYNDFRPTVASGEKAQEICNLMNTYSQNCSNIEIDELGNLHVN